MRFYHGTTTAVLPSIRRLGLQSGFPERNSLPVGRMEAPKGVFLALTTQGARWFAQKACSASEGDCAGVVLTVVLDPNDPLLCKDPSWQGVGECWSRLYLGSIPPENIVSVDLLD